MFQEQYLRDTQFINLYYYYEFNNLVLFIIIDTATHDHYILHSHCSALVFGNSVNFRGIWALRLAWAKSSCRTHLSSVWQTRATGVISITGVCISSATLEWVWYMSLRLLCRFLPFHSFFECSIRLLLLLRDNITTITAFLLYLNRSKTDFSAIKYLCQIVVDFVYGICMIGFWQVFFQGCTRLNSVKGYLITFEICYAKAFYNFS